MSKKIISSEQISDRPSVKDIINWIAGLVMSTLGVCLCTKANFGLSMIAASPYILHVGLRDILPWFTQGTAEYVWEAVILAVCCLIVKGFRPRYLLSFGTAVLAGLGIDGWLIILGGNGQYESLMVRILTFVIGSLLIAFGVAFFFRSVMPQEVYELAVLEISKKYDLNQNKVKLGNDIVMLALSVALSRLLTHGWTGIGIGTIIVTFANAPLIAMFGRLIDNVIYRE